MSVCFFYLKKQPERKSKMYLVRYITQRFERKEKKYRFLSQRIYNAERGAAKGAGDKCITYQIPSHTDRESLHELGVKSDIESSGERLYKLTEASSWTKRTSFFQMLIFVMLAQNRSCASSKTERPICYLSICDCFKKECVI